MKFTTAKGLFSGSFLDAGLTAKFNGVIVDEGATQVAYGCFLIPETTTAGANKVSGSVLIETNPVVP